jgi:hypothetical protein
VEKRRVVSDQHLNELYREHPVDFVARRNELVKKLRADGDRDEAERIRKLRRPTVPAWLINRVALDSPELLEEFAATSRAVEETQRRALAGDEEATDEWRAAAVHEREAIAAVRDAADRAAGDTHGPPSPGALEQVVETLRAAGGDPQLRDRVVRGRVERERSAATLGIGAPSDLPRPRRKAEPLRRRDEAQARRERKALEAELANAAAREERLRAVTEDRAEALRQARAELADTKRETAALRRRLKAIERRARH